MGLVPLGMHMQKTTAPPATTIPVNVSEDVLDWDHVDPKHVAIGKDVLGLSPEDRRALGLSAPRMTDLEAPTLGGAEAALAEVLARGGAMPAKTRTGAYVPSSAVGNKPDLRRKRG